MRDIDQMLVLLFVIIKRRFFGLRELMRMLGNFLKVESIKGSHQKKQCIES